MTVHEHVWRLAQTLAQQKRMHGRSEVILSDDEDPYDEPHVLAVLRYVCDGCGEARTDVYDGPVSGLPAEPVPVPAAKSSRPERVRSGQ